MFKPHYGTCTHKDCKQPEDALIVVSKGWCQYCNHNEKQAKKKAAGKSTGYSYTKKTTGEKDVFEVVLENLGDTETRCFVCKERISLVTHHNFAHILRKGSYPLFRLNPDNIRIMCYKLDGTGCHSKFDFNPRSELKGENWERVFELEERLKEEYKQLKNITNL